MVFLAALMWGGMSTDLAALEIKAAVLRIDPPRLAPISRYEKFPEDNGFAGAQLADEDNGTTGTFLGHTYETMTVAVPPEEADAALDAILADGIRFIILMADDADLARLADRAAQDGAVVFNAQAEGVALRDNECRANVLHVAPSRAMRADAVAQFALWKRWPRWFLIHGSNPEDQALADAYRRAAKKFGGRIAEEREFEDTGGSRRTDTGHVLVQRQLPVFTQDADDHEVVIAADESDVFAPYLPFHLWTPRPVMGAAGLRPVTIHGAHEAWGATQFQRRFEELTGRYIREEDYQVWLSLRVLGEAVIRTSSNDPQTILDYAISDEFELAAFKGVPVTFRPWNGQLRQPILLYDGRITVSVSPQDGFLHQVSPLDTLGLDKPESSCTAFN
ncbi:MAG: ABC transporter substrate-binding protein [Pseudomonadota bacterium]|nr:ABC transporter substrate-binding protein [Pseudomonadota bacterium]MEC8580026.1 ABC transporter substrate-binding protein [Pseudomonadota bacterium]